MVDVHVKINKQGDKWTGTTIHNSFIIHYLSFIWFLPIMHKLTFPIDASEKFNKDILEVPGTEPQLADVMLNHACYLSLCGPPYP